MPIMKKFFLSAFSTLCVLLPTLAQAEQLLNDANQQQTIYVTPKEILIVKLPSTPSTGYMWQFSPPDDGTVKLLNNWKYTPSKKNTVGVSGEASWRLQAGHVGKTNLRFTYRRPWEDVRTPPAQIREYNIVVRGGKSFKPALKIKPWF